MFDYYVGTSPITSKKIRTEYKKYGYKLLSDTIKRKLVKT